MKKVILYIAQSLDGYVATKDGGVAWLDPFNGVEGIDYGYADFVDGIDTVVQGNTTYKQFKHAYEGKQNYVFSHTTDPENEEKFTFVKGSPTEFINNLDEEVHKNIWLVGGPSLLTQFANERQVDEMIIFTMPVLLGEGISLFENLEKKPVLTLKSSNEFDNGVVELHYLVEK